MVEYLYFVDRDCIIDAIYGSNKITLDVADELADRIKQITPVIKLQIHDKSTWENKGEGQVWQNN